MFSVSYPPFLHFTFFLMNASDAFSRSGTFLHPALMLLSSDRSAFVFVLCLNNTVTFLVEIKFDFHTVWSQMVSVFSFAHLLNNLLVL